MAKQAIARQEKNQKGILKNFLLKNKIILASVKNLLPLQHNNQGKRYFKLS